MSIEEWSDAAIEKGATAKDIMITWMDPALAALANAETVRVWFKGTGAASLAHAVLARIGGGERAEAMRLTTANCGCEMGDLTDKQWREALTQLWDAFLVKFGETPARMLGRLTGMKYGEKGYDDELPGDFIRRGSTLHQEYLEALQRVGGTSMYSEATAINKLLGSLAAVLTGDRVQRLRELIQSTKKRQVSFTRFAEEVEDQWSRQEDLREEVIMARGVVDALPPEYGLRVVGPGTYQQREPAREQRLAPRREPARERLADNRRASAGSTSKTGPPKRLLLTQVMGEDRDEHCPEYYDSERNLAIPLEEPRPRATSSIEWYARRSEWDGSRPQSEERRDRSDPRGGGRGGRNDRGGYGGRDDRGRRSGRHERGGRNNRSEERAPQAKEDQPRWL